MEDGTASSASPSGSEELWWRWQTMQGTCGFCGLCSTDCALFLRSRIKSRLVALVAQESNRYFNSGGNRVEYLQKRMSRSEDVGANPIPIPNSEAQEAQKQNLLFEE
jgi:hypothetical protein